jgi:protein-L-isoaspartate(D-aspartate) O-methyltransferase
VRSDAIVRAFPDVPRERFLGRAVADPRLPRGLLDDADADATHVYHNVLIAIDPTQRLNNGQPALWAYLFDAILPHAGERALHIGAGTGY